MYVFVDGNLAPSHSPQPCSLRQLHRKFPSITQSHSAGININVTSSTKIIIRTFKPWTQKIVCTACTTTAGRTRLGELTIGGRRKKFIRKPGGDVERGIRDMEFRQPFEWRRWDKQKNDCCVGGGYRGFVERRLGANDVTVRWNLAGGATWIVRFSL